MIRAKVGTGTTAGKWNRRCLMMEAAVSIVIGCACLAEHPEELIPKAVYIQSTSSDSIKLGFRKPEHSVEDLEATNKSPQFYAIQSLKWPNGLVPVYQTRDKKSKEWKLSRRLTHGKENFTEPLFFALPPNAASSEPVLSGRWACEAMHLDGSIDFLHWEMGLDGEIIFGRFDQDTDYRFAWLNGGTFKGNNLRFDAEYIDAKYELEGSLSSNLLKGTWKHTEDADGGTWVAEPAYPVSIENRHWKVVDLYQKTSPSTGKQILSVDSPGSDESRLLCRVWLQKKEP